MPTDTPGNEPLSPMDELELADLQAQGAGLDEHDTMFDPDTHPKPPHTREEAVTDERGVQTDIMRDTPPVDVMTLTDVFPDSNLKP